MEEEEPAVLGLGREAGRCAQAPAEEASRTRRSGPDHPAQGCPVAWWVIIPGELEVYPGVFT